MPAQPTPRATPFTATRKPMPARPPRRPGNEGGALPMTFATHAAPVRMGSAVPGDGDR